MPMMYVVDLNWSIESVDRAEMPIYAVNVRKSDQRGYIWVTKYGGTALRSRDELSPHPTWEQARDFLLRRMQRQQRKALAEFTAAALAVHHIKGLREKDAK